MLDPGPNHGDDPIDALIDRIQLSALGGLSHDTPALAGAFERSLAFGTDIGLVYPDRGLVAMEQRVPDLTVIQPGGRVLEAVGDAAVGIDTDVGLHAKVPGVSLLRRRHLGVAPGPCSSSKSAHR